jgi:hypothetical protein
MSVCRLTTCGFDRAMEEKFGLNLPPYPGYDQIVELEPGVRL